MKFMKKALTLTAISLALLLSSCNSQNSINNKTIKNAEKSAVSQAYANVDDILGKDYGNVKMPAKVTVYDFEKLYKLSVNYSCFLDQNIDYEKEGKEIFKKFFNEDFDESKCGFDIENYYYEYDDGNLYASYHQNFIALKIDFYSSGGEVEINQTAKIRDGENLQLDFGDKKIPASEVAEKASEYMTDFFGDYYGELVMQPFDIHTFDYDGEILAEVVFTQNYRGFDLEFY